MRRSRSGALLLLPLAGWLLLFLLLPYFFILIQAFLATDDFGKVIYRLNIDSYLRLFTNHLYYSTLIRTFVYALVVAFFLCTDQHSLAYFIAFKTKRNKTTLYSLIVLPFWISYIVRAYAWKIILGENGILEFLFTSNRGNRPSCLVLALQHFLNTGLPRLSSLHLLLPYQYIPLSNRS
jgi:spermidine/putrescine transport system permease protein